MARINPLPRDFSTFEGDDVCINFMPQIQKIMISDSKHCRIFELEEAIDFTRNTGALIRNKPKEIALGWIKNAMNMVRIVGSFYGYRKTCSVAEDILQICFQSEFPDSERVIELLRILDSHRHQRFLNRHVVPPYASLVFSVNTEEERLLYRCNYSSYFLRHAKRMKETFKGKWFARNCYESVITCAMLHNRDILKVMLQNGFCSSFSRSHRRYFKSAMSHLTFQKLCLYRRSIRSFCNQRDVTKVEKELAIIQTILFHIFRVQKSPDRDYFVSGNEDDLRRIHQNLPLLFSAIPIPSSRIPKDIANTSCKEDGNFGELKYEEKIAPCSLQHLSRCAIRQRLGEKFLLPEGISQLELPTIMRAYLNLETD